MKAKVAKKEQSADKKLLAIKKSKTDIKKAKKPKSEVKPTAVKAAAAAAGGATAAAVPLTFAEKKALSVKRKAKPVPETKTITAPKPAKVSAPADAGKPKQAEKKSKKKGKKSGAVPAAAPAPATAAAKPEEKENKPLGKKGKFGKQPKVKKPPPVTATGKRKAQLSAVKKQEQAKGGEVAQEAAPETLALVPDQLVTEDTLTKCFQVLHKKVADVGDKLFGNEMVFGLQVTSVKVPKCPFRNNRISLPHSLAHPNDEVCLIVKDLIRGRNVDYDKTLHHWEDKLNELGIKEKVTILPFQQLKRDCNTFELKRKLVHRYERFLVDARIGGHVFMFLGAVFARRNKNPIPVKLEDDAKIKESIDKALLVQTYSQANSGRSTVIKFATQWMPVEQAVENGMAVIELLKTVHPGGWLNVQSLHITTSTEKMQSLPLYISMIDPNAVPVPVVVGPREKFLKKQQYLLNRRTGGQYVVTKDGVVRKATDESDDEIELDEIEREEDDNWLPYDAEPPKRRRSGGGRPPRSAIKIRTK